MINTLQMIIPPALKAWLRPHYRKVFPNRPSVLLMPSLRCNYGCSYCILAWLRGKAPARKDEHTPDEWIRALDRLGRCGVLIGGGEPTMFQGLPELVNRLDHDIFGIITNGSAPLEIYAAIEKRLYLQISYHREYVKEEKFLAKLKAIGELHRFRIGVNIVASRENLAFIPAIEKQMRGLNYCLEVLPMFDQKLGFNYTPEEIKLIAKHPSTARAMELNRDRRLATSCSAGRNHVLIASDGQVYRCQGWWYWCLNPLLADGRHHAMGNVFDADFRLAHHDAPCDIPCLCDCDRPMVIRKVKK